MEAMLIRSSPAVPQERRAEFYGGEEDADDRITTDEQLESTRTEMGEVKQENERLKTTLSQIMRDYQSLQRHYFGIVKQEQDRRTALENPKYSTTRQQTVDESELVSLSLGTTSSGGHRVKEEKAAGKACKDRDHEQMKGVLSLGLEYYCRSFEGSCGERQANASPESSLGETCKEEEDAPAPGRVIKTMRSEEGGDASELISPVKRAKVSVRVRCDTPTMNDGCQWRKYGQKISKGNPRPRAYYRCTVAPSCPVRKQVQRCAEDMSILITTYEGTHNHPLAISATAMAATTSAAASMLMSGSTAAASHRPVSSIGASTTGDHYAAATSGGLNFGLSDHMFSGRRQQFYPPNPSTISPSPSCPTITLDLTAPAPPSSSSSPAAQFGRLPSSSVYRPPIKSCLAFDSVGPPAPWSSTAGHLNYYTTHPYNTKPSLQVGFSNLGCKSPGHQEPVLYRTSLMQKVATHEPAPLAATYNGSLTDTAIAAAAAAKVITSDPNFQSALAAAITSMVGGNGGSQGVAETLPRPRNPGWEEKLQLVSTVSHFAPHSGGGGNGSCASSFLTRSSTCSARSDSQQPSALTMLPPPSLAFPSSKSTSASPGDQHAAD